MERTIVVRVGPTCLQVVDVSFLDDGIGARGDAVLKSVDVVVEEIAGCVDGVRARGLAQSVDFAIADCDRSGSVGLNGGVGIRRNTTILDRHIGDARRDVDAAVYVETAEHRP